MNTIDISVRDRGLGVRDRQGGGEPLRDEGTTGWRLQVVLDHLLAVRLPRRPGRPRRLDPVRVVHGNPGSPNPRDPSNAQLAHAPLPARHHTRLCLQICRWYETALEQT